MEKEKIELELPWPPSGNHRNGISGGKFYRLKKTKDYYARVAWLFRSIGAPQFSCNDTLEIELLIYPPDKRLRDLDNILKTVLDSLQPYPVLNDHCFAVMHLYRREVVKEGKVVIKITTIPPKIAPPTKTYS